MLRVIIVNLKGGLGNQMFQYALGYTLAKNKKVPLFFDLRLMEEEKKKTFTKKCSKRF